MTPTITDIERMNRVGLMEAIRRHPSQAGLSGISHWSRDELVRLYASLVGVDPDAEEL
jgi:hypothetical protein